MIEHLAATSADGQAMRLAVSGQLTHEDYVALIPVIERQIACIRQVSVLVELTAITGIEPRAILDEFVFDIRHLSDFDRLAVVGEKDWEDWMTRPPPT